MLIDIVLHAVGVYHAAVLPLTDRLPCKIDGGVVVADAGGYHGIYRGVYAAAHYFFWMSARRRWCFLL